MANKILMPALSPTMEEGNLARWLVKEKDKVRAGDVIAEIETDKATMDFESLEDGFMGEILIKEGTENVKVNTPIAVFITDDHLKNVESKSTKKIPEKKEKIEVKGSEKQSLNKKSLKSSPLKRETMEGKKNITQTVREALRDALAEEMRADENVFLIGEEVGEYQGAYKISQGLLKEFGSKRIIDTPITENGFTGIAVGSAYGGLRPVVEFMTFNFSMQAIDHIINSAAKTLYMSGGQLGVPIVFRGPNGAAARVAAQHSQDYAAWYSHIPGLKVVAPYSAADAKGLLKSSIRDPNPVIFLENEILYGQTFDVPSEEEFLVPLGKARVWREGKDVTLVSFGIGMKHTLKAAEELAVEGIECEVIDLRTLRPLDYTSVLKSVQKTNCCVTIEEGFPVGSIGNHISAFIIEQAFDYLDAPIINCTGKDVPMPYAENLEKCALITVEEIIKAAKQVTYRQ